MLMTVNRYSGQGSATGIEDAVVLSELLSSASPDDDLKPLVDMYEKLRRPRCEKIQAYARYQGQKFSTDDPKLMEERMRQWKALDKNADPVIKQKIAEVFKNAVPDEDAPYGSPGHMLWLDHYDALAVVKQAMTDNSIRRGKL